MNASRLIAAPAAFVAALYATYAPPSVIAATSQPTTIIGNAAESLLWHSAPAGTSTFRWEKPESATSATLTITGAYFSKTVTGLTGESCEVTLPATTGGKENVFKATLEFDDGTTQTAYLGEVDGLASGGEATNHRIRTTTSPNWANFNDCTAVAIPVGATSLTVNGTALPDLDGEAGWRLLKHSGAEHYVLAMNVVGAAEPITATVYGIPSATMVLFR